MAATYSEIRGYCIGLRFLFMPGAEMPPRLVLTIAGSWCPAHLKTRRFQSSKITNCFISSKTFPPLFVIKITASIHAHGCDAGATGGDSRCTPIYIYVQTSGGGNRAECHLLALGFYYHHMLKWYKNVCVKTLDDFILNL